MRLKAIYQEEAGKWNENYSKYVDEDRGCIFSPTLFSVNYGGADPLDLFKTVDFRGKNVIDLGCGDRRVLLTMGIAGAEEMKGRELLYHMILFGGKVEKLALKEGLIAKKTDVVQGCFLKADLKKIDVIFYSYLSNFIPKIEERLKTKLKNW